MKTKEYEIHPLAETYPPMSAPEMEALTADIAERGLQRPIVLYEGKILDGRNRYLACQGASVEPTFTQYEGDDPLGQVNSLNLNRDLTAGQRAIIAARQWGFSGYSKGGRPSPKIAEYSQVSLPRLSRQFRVDGKYIRMARDLLAEAPDLATMVEASSLSLAKATEQLDERQRKARQATKDAARVAEYSEAISNGELTLEEALEAALRRDREEKERLKNEKMSQEIWFEHLAEILKWLDEWPGIRSDEELAQINSPDAPQTDYAITREDVEEGIRQLQRIAASTPGRASNGRRAQRGQKTYADRIRETQGSA